MGIGAEWDIGFSADSVGGWGQGTQVLCWRFSIGNKGVNGDPSTHEPSPPLDATEAGAMWHALIQGGQSGMEAWIASNRQDLAAWWGNRPAWQRSRLMGALLKAHDGF
jgi:hypothetical protein